MSVKIIIDGIDVRDVLQKAHISQIVDNEKLEGRDGWMFLCGMSAMVSFCADSPEELDDQTMLTEKAYEVAVAMAESEGAYREKLIELSEKMVDFLEEIIEGSDDE